jgi:serine/threonine-protein kinase
VDLEQTSVAGPVRISRYGIEKKLGDGAFGAVYLAEDERSRKLVRLRILPEAVHLDPVQRAREIADAKAAMQVEHPGLAMVLDISDTPEGFLLVSESVSGLTLRDVLAQRGKIDVAEALRLATEMASAMAAAHRMGVVHGMLGDERVFISDDGRVHIVDLGLIELIRPLAELTVDARTDVYSLGAMLYEMLSGTRVNTNELSSEPREVLPRLDRFAPEVPQDLIDIIRKATAPAPGDRFADADELLAALSRVVLPTEPIAEQASVVRAEIGGASATRWILGASIMLALLITIGIALVMNGH